MIVAVDLGNSRAKWAVHPGDRPVAGRFVADGAVDAGAIGSLRQTLAPFTGLQALIACSVAGSAAEQALAEVAGALRVRFRQALPGPDCAGVRNLYSTPARLGADRWAALVGARARGARAAVVVDAGTAMTVDALAADGRFLGGLIVPGLDLMRKALAGGTARLPFAAGTFRSFPRATADAIQSGALQALCGAVVRMHQTMVDDGHAAPRLLLTGGSAVLLAPLLAAYSPLLAPQLVLEGLIAIAIDDCNRNAAEDLR